MAQLSHLSNSNSDHVSGRILEEVQSVLDSFVQTGNAQLQFPVHTLSTCEVGDFPTGAAMVFAFVESACVQQIDASWQEGDPPILWHASEKLPPQPASPGGLRHLFAVDEPTLSRNRLLRQLVGSLALEQAVLITDDPMCGSEWDAGPVVCVGETIRPEDVERVKAQRSPVLVLDLYVLAQGKVGWGFSHKTDTETQRHKATKKESDFACLYVSVSLCLHVSLHEV